MAATTERKQAAEILEEIVTVCFAALDPILTRPDLIQKIREIYDLAAPDDEEDENDFDSGGESPER
jgi:hypothetical protein